MTVSPLAGLGRLHQYDRRNLSYALPMLAVPTDVRRRFWWGGSVLDQRDTAQCVGYAGWGWLYGGPVTNVPDFTPADLYHWAQESDEWDGEESAEYIAARWINHMAATHGADCPGRHCDATRERSAAAGAIYGHLRDLAGIPIEHQQYRPPGYYEGYRTALLDLLVHLGLDEEGPRV